MSGRTYQMHVLWEYKFQTIPRPICTKENWSLQVNCSAKHKGCEWVGKLETFTEHHKIKQCKYTYVSCSRCDSTVIACDYQQHMDSECPNRRIECTTCRVLIPVSQLTDGSHNTVCDCVIVKCNKRMCLLKFPRWFRQSHNLWYCVMSKLHTCKRNTKELKEKVADVEKDFNAHRLYKTLIHQLYMSEILFFEHPQSCVFSSIDDIPVQITLSFDYSVNIIIEVMEDFEEPFEIKGYVWFVLQNKIGDFNSFNKMYYLDLNDIEYSIVCTDFIEVSRLELNEVTQTQYAFDDMRNGISFISTFASD